MRFILHNIHEYVWYKYPIFQKNNQKIGVCKYDYIVDWLLQNKKKVYVYMDADTYYEKKWMYLLKMISYYKMIFKWARLNKISPFKFRLITNVKSFKKNDAIFLFYYNYFSFSELNDYILKRISKNQKIALSKAYKIVHVTHFFYNIQFGNNNLQNFNPDMLIAENNLLKNSEYFKTNFSWYHKLFYTLSFVPKNRFIKINDFDQRFSKAIVTGTITFPIECEIFKDFFKSDILQPMRIKIFEAQHNISHYIDSFIKPIEGLEKKYQQINYSYPYPNKSIVEIFNMYKMFIVPEEIVGLPGVSYVEGMACGSAFIGLDDAIYTDIGLIDRINYIAYNGSMEDLIIKIDYYQNHPKELEQIANNGYEFVRNNLNKEKIIGDFMTKVEQILHK